MKSFFIILFLLCIQFVYADENPLSIHEYNIFKQSIIKKNIIEPSFIYENQYLHSEYSDSNPHNSKVNFGVIGLEWAGGCLGGISTGTLSTVIGYVLIPNYQASNFFNIYILGCVGLPFGTALGTTLTGKMLNQKGSYCRSFWWSVGGTIASIAFFYVPGLINKDGDPFYDYLTAFVSIALPTSCAVYGFNIRDKSSYGFNDEKFEYKKTQYQALFDRAPRVNTFTTELIRFNF